MKRRLLIALLVFAVVVAAFWGWREFSVHRASYQGKTVSEWAVQLYATYEPTGTNAAAVAFRAMSSNSVPALRSLLHRRDPAYEKVLIKYARYIPTKPRVYLFQKLQPGRVIEYRLGAARALGVLGLDAITALPDMLELLGDSDGRLRWTMAQTVHRLGSEAVAGLIPLTTNADMNVRHAAVYALSEARTNALPAVPALIRSSMDTNEAVRGSALYALSRVGYGAVPPILEIAATEKDPALQNAALRSLVAVRPPPGQVMRSHLMISTNSPDIRRMALMTLWISRQTNQHALKLYNAGLTDEDVSVRDLAQKIIERLNSTNRHRIVPL